MIKTFFLFLQRHPEASGQEEDPIHESIKMGKPQNQCLKTTRNNP
jgi:hypothetical protein